MANSGAEIESAVRFYRFGEFEVDIVDETLRREGEKVNISPRMFQVLLLLLQRSGEIVTKDEFFEKIWDGAFVEDNNLTVAVRGLRKALQDDAKQARFIENLPRKGYRFIAPVSVGSLPTVRSRPDDKNVLLTGADPGHVPNSRRPFRKVFAVSALVLIIIISIAAVSYRGYWNTPSAVYARVDSIAILPFKSADPNSEYLADGLTDGIINGLSKLSGARVIDRNSTIQFKGKTIDPARISSDLNVGSIVTGQIEQFDGSLVISAELIDLDGSSRPWKRQFRRTEAELFATQQEIVNELLEYLTPGNSAAKPEAARDPKVFELYMKGQYYLDRRAESDFKLSVGYFKQTIDLDPTFARAYVGLSEAYTLGAFVDLKFAPGEKNALIRATIQKALDIDPNLGEAYASRAINRCYYDWDFAGAESDYRRAIELVPSNATAHHWYAEFLSMQGRFEESYREYDKAISLDPLSMAIKTDLAVAHFYARDYDGSMEMLKKVKTIDPDFLRTESYIFWIHRLRGEYEMAIDCLERFISMEAKNGIREDKKVVMDRINGLRKQLAQNGAAGFWRANSEMYGPDNYQPSLAIAQLGDKDKAFALLEAAFKERSSGLVWLKVEPLLDPLRNDPRFEDLMRRVGFTN